MNAYKQESIAALKLKKYVVVDANYSTWAIFIFQNIYTFFLLLEVGFALEIPASNA